MTCELKSFKVTFAPNLSVADPENFEEFKAREVLKIRKEKTGISPTSLVR